MQSFGEPAQLLAAIRRWQADDQCAQWGGGDAGCCWQHDHEQNPDMTLCLMRTLGVRSIWATDARCACARVLTLP